MQIGHTVCAREPAAHFASSTYRGRNSWKMLVTTVGDPGKQAGLAIIQQ
jgi:hypothetical protein